MSHKAKLRHPGQVTAPVTDPAPETAKSPAETPAQVTAQVTAPVTDDGADSLAIEPPPAPAEGEQVAPASQPSEPAEPGHGVTIPAAELVAEPVAPVWPRDCTVEIPLCLLGERRFNACESEEDAVQRYLTLGGIRGSKHKPIVRPLESCTHPEPADMLEESRQRFIADAEEEIKFLTEQIARAKAASPK